MGGIPKQKVIKGILDIFLVFTLQAPFRFYISQCKTHYEKNKITAHKKRLTMTAESEPVREPTDHRCERCGKVFAKAEELTNHYKGEHAE